MRLNNISKRPRCFGVKMFLKYLISLYKGVKFLVIVTIVTMILSHGAVLARNLIVKNLIDMPFQDGFKYTDLYFTAVILMLAYALELIFFYISTITRSITIVRKQNPYIYKKLFGDLNRKSYSFFADNHSGKITQSIGDTQGYVANLNNRLGGNGVANASTMVTNLIILYVIDLYLFVTALVVFMGIVITRCVYFQFRYMPLSRAAAVKHREFSGILNDAVLNFMQLRVFNSVDDYANTVETKKTEAVKLDNRASRREFSYGGMANFFFFCVMGGMLYYSIWRFSRGEMTIGDFSYFIIASIALKSATTHFSWDYIIVSDAIIKIKSCYDLLYGDNNLGSAQPQTLTVSENAVKFENVTFKYRSKNIFTNLNFEIAPNQKVGIIGVSGSGKTTLVNLLFRFYEPETGKILIDGKDIREFSTASLYENMTFVPQETILLHDTIYENIKIARPTATRQEIENAVKRAELKTFVDGLDDKYDTVVGERGIKLSGGQRQRIALARIFLRSAKILVFDEATSSLDNNTEFLIQDNINKYLLDKTIICIAHRLTSLVNMDKIYVLENGEIIDSGTPEQIIPKYGRIQRDEPE